MQTRRLTRADLAIWKEIRLEAVKLHPESFYGSYEEESKQSDEEFLRWLENSVVFGCFENNHLLGVAGYYFMKGKKVAHKATIVTVYVRTAARGKGLMDALLKGLEEYALANGIIQLTLSVGQLTPYAKRCYERNGYKEYGIEPRGLNLDGTFHDENWMIKLLK